MCHSKVDVIAGEATAAAYKCYKNQEYQDLYNSSVAVMLREMQRETHLKASFTLIILSIIIRLIFTQQMILIVALCLSLMEKTNRTQNYEKL